MLSLIHISIFNGGKTVWNWMDIEYGQTSSICSFGHYHCFCNCMSYFILIDSIKRITVIERSLAVSYTHLAKLYELIEQKPEMEKEGERL